MFVNPWFLMLLPLAGLPVIIHMIHRQKYRIHDFSTLLFFDRSRKYNVFRLRLRHVLLMCLRIAIVLLAVLAFSRISIPDFGVGDKRQAAVLVIDGSYSMQQRFGDGTMFEFAKRQALQSLEELDPGTLIGLVSNEPSPKLAVPATSDIAAVREAITSLKPFHREGTAWDATAVAQEALSNVRAASREVVVLTDFQHSAWLPEQPEKPEGTPGAADSPGAPDHPGREVSIRFVALKPKHQENLAIVGVGVQQAPVTVGRPARFVPAIHNFSEKDVAGLLLTAGHGSGQEKDQAPAESVRIDIPAKSILRVSLFFTFSIGGPQAIWFKIEDDALRADNQWVSAVSVSDAVPVLCMGGDADGRKEETRKRVDDLFFLSNALAPTGESNNISLVVSETSQLSKMGLYGYSCVFLAGVKGLDEKGAKIIRDYVKRGGGLVLFLGEGTDEESLKLLLAEDTFGSVAPVQIAGLVEGSDKIAKVDFHGSTVGATVGHLADELRGVAFNKRYRLSLSPTGGHAAQTLAVFSDGSPWIVETRYGFGRCILFSGGCSSPGTDFQFRAMFPTLMQQLARHLSRPVRSLAPDTRPGELFAASFQEAQQPMKARAILPDGGEGSVHLERGEDHFGLVFGETSLPGYYQVQAAYQEDDEDTALEGFAINADGADSDLSAANADQVTALFSEMPISVEQLDKPVLKSGLLGTSKREIMRLILALLLLVVILENVVSWLSK